MNKSVPAIRFEGVDEEWVESHFYEWISRVSSRAKQSALPRVEYEDIVSGEGLLNNNILEKESSKQGIEFEIGDVIFGKLRPYLRNWLLPTFAGVAVGDFWVFRMKDTDCRFLYYFIQTSAFETIANQSAGSKMPRSDWKVVSSSLFSKPYNSNEQTRIGIYFQHLDALIAGHRRKREKLLQLKKSLLQKMFPKQGQDKPEIRFAGFDEDWKEEKVNKLLTERNMQAPKSIAYPLMAFVSSVGVTAKGKRYNREFLVNDEFNKNYKQTEYGDFIYSSNNLETGSIGLNNYGSASISPVYSIFQTTEHAESNFIGRLLVKQDFINKMLRWRQGVVYGQWKIHEKNFLEIEVQYPKVEEQTKIGQLFKHTDTLIDRHQSQITKLLNIKQACLAKMFV